MENAIDIPSQSQPVRQTQAVVPYENNGAIGRAMTAEELHQRLEFVRQIMAREMKEGQDYGKIPGCGDKPGLFQPGAQKLLMTFNLREQVKVENRRDLQDGHRDYEFTVTVFPSGQSPQSGWDGVGTCSTMESKYRFRSAQRTCPKCGRASIIKGKAEYGGGWLCFTKKGGCGEKFAADDTSITSQPDGRVEYDNPADYWNTVRKMAFKRALVSAAINATNTSELWSQDLEDIAANQSHVQESQNAPGRAASDSGGQNVSKGAKASPAAKEKQDGASKPASMKAATDKTRLWMIEQIGAGEGQGGREIANEYFREIGWLMPNEVVEDLPLRFVPTSKKQLDLLLKFGGAWAAGGKPKKPYEPNPEQEDLPKAAAKQATTQAGDWTQVQIPFGKSKGTKLGDLDKKVLFGWCQNFEVKAQYEKQGKTVDRPKGMVEKDKAFRAALDAAAKAMAKKGESE